MNIVLGHKPTRQELMALTRLRQPEHSALVKLLNDRLEEVKTSLVSIENVDQLRRNQGVARAMQDFLEAIEKSPEVLERLK